MFTKIRYIIYSTEIEGNSHEWWENEEEGPSLEEFIKEMKQVVGYRDCFYLVMGLQVKFTPSSQLLPSTAVAKRGYVSKFIKRYFSSYIVGPEVHYMLNPRIARTFRFVKTTGFEIIQKPNSCEIMENLQ